MGPLFGGVYLIRFIAYLGTKKDGFSHRGFVTAIIRVRGPGMVGCLGSGF